jgi:hypothetical protein
VSKIADRQRSVMADLRVSHPGLFAKDADGVGGRRVADSEGSPAHGASSDHPSNPFRSVRSDVSADEQLARLRQEHSLKGLKRFNDYADGIAPQPGETKSERLDRARRQRPDLWQAAAHPLEPMSHDGNSLRPPRSM